MNVLVSIHVLILVLLVVLIGIGIRETKGGILGGCSNIIGLLPFVGRVVRIPINPAVP
jgi:hypothetical protein